MGLPPSDAVITRLLWREQARALPAAVGHGLRRLLRREPRWYLSVDGHVVARMVSAGDRERLLGWISDIHGDTFNRGVEFGKGVQDAVHRREADARDAGTP